MGLATRIIPTLLIRGDQLVKGKQFDAWRSVGVPLQAVKTHQARGVDELIILDIGATPEGRGPNLALIEKLTAECFSPVTVGGGVRSVQDVRDMLNAGADKVAIGTAAWESIALVKECADKFGSQAISLCADHWDRHPYVRGKVVPSCVKGVWHHLKEFERAGAGEIILTAVREEGMMNGYECGVLAAVCVNVSVPVIAHGGCGTPQHMLEAIQAGASAVAAGALFQFSDTTPRDCARYLHQHGVEVRL